MGSRLVRFFRLFSFDSQPGQVPSEFPPCSSLPGETGEQSGPQREERPGLRSQPGGPAWRQRDGEGGTSLRNIPKGWVGGALGRAEGRGRVCTSQWLSSAFSAHTHAYTQPHTVRSPPAPNGRAAHDQHSRTHSQSTHERCRATDALGHTCPLDTQAAHTGRLRGWTACPRW